MLRLITRVVRPARMIPSGLITGVVSVAVVVATVTCPAHESPTVTAPVTPTASVSTAPTSLGMAYPADIYWNSVADTTAGFDLVAKTSMKSVRLPIFWGLIQPVGPTGYDWTVIDRLVNDAASRGLGILASIGSTPAWAAAPGASGPYARPADPAVFAAFVTAVVDRYKDRISSYEIWNEPNGALFYSPTPDPVSYTGLLVAAYRAVKAADPRATVVAGALGSVEDSATTADPVRFLARMYAAGARGNFDALSFHPYKYDLSLSAAWTVPNSPGQQLTGLRRLMIANGDSKKKIWATEYGVPTVTISEDRQNAMVADFAEKWNELPYAGPIFFFTDRDRSTGNGVIEDNFGLQHTDRSAKDAMWTVFADAYLGVPTTPEDTRFAAGPYNIAWGQALSPVVPVTTTDVLARFYQNETLYETPTGFIGSPAPVSARVTQIGTYPVSTFTNGYQDLAAGGRAYYSMATGVHVAGNGVVEAWTPDYGLALTDEVPQGGGGVKVTFQHGFIIWTPTTGAVGTRT